MEYVLPIIITAISIALIMAVVYFLRKRVYTTGGNDATKQAVSADIAVTKGNPGSELSIPIELLLSTVQIDENSLVEITDRSVVARITQVLPAVAEVASRTLTANATNAALQQTAKAANVAVQNVNKIL